MSLIPSFALAKALREVELFRPTGDQMHDLVAEIHAWLDRVKFNRGEIVDPAADVDVILRDADEMIGG